jgi:hypothetical protein
MISFAVAFSLLVFATSGDASLRSHQSNRQLSFELIAGYEVSYDLFPFCGPACLVPVAHPFDSTFFLKPQPRSSVTDHNALDLDQKMMEEQLALKTTQSYQTAKAIYTQGAHSKSIATVTLSSGLLNAVPAGTSVSGTNEAGSEISGKTYEDYPIGSTIIRIQYQTIAVQSNYVGCQVGGNPEPKTEGCFAASGSLTINGEGVSYNYNPLTDNGNGRTLQGFSTEAQAKMHECTNCPYETYEKFYQYYGVFDYANQWVLAAFDGDSTSFANGNANFAAYDFEGRSEAIKKGTAYMSVWMYVIREMEDALDDCKEKCTIENCNDDPVHAWDEAVAFYTGSLEGTEGSGDGVFLHQLADKRCANFRTCGDLGDEIEGVSHVNIEIFRHFTAGLSKVLRGECSSARTDKERIEQLMAVPLIQGALRYAYITEKELDAGEKAEAEGATFAAAVLPLVHACNEEAAQTIYNNLRTNQGGTANFAEVKQSFESVYDCMNVRCEDVGGLYDDTTGSYMDGAAPCGFSGSEKNVGLIVGLCIGGILLVAVLIVVWNRTRNGKEY